MNLQGLLDQLLKGGGSSGGKSGGALGGLGGALGGLTGGGGSKPGNSAGGGLGGMLNADFGKGAIAGGALGLLLGKNKSTRKLATYGGLAAIGVMAYRAYGDYKQKQGETVQPQTVDRIAAPEAALHSEAILRALVAAAKADGHLDAREREVIEGEFTRLNPDAEVQRWLHAELEKPLDPADVARAASTPEIASEMYLASLVAADEQNFMERAYLDELAKQMGIDAALKQRLEEEARNALVAAR